MRKHVQHLLVGYVHGSLTAQQKRRVALHLADCPACRAALIGHEQTARDMREGLPRLGAPAPSQLARMWAVIRGRLALPDSGRLPVAGLQMFGAVVGILVSAVFGLSVLLGGAHAMAAAPLPPVPAQIQATETPIITRAPENSQTQLHASPTAIVYNNESLPAASPAPVARW